MSNRVSKYADNEADERKLLAALPFLSRANAAYVRDTGHPIALVRAELHRVYAKEMARYDQTVLEARAAAKAPATMSRSELAALEASCQAKDEPTFSDAECATYQRTLGLDLRSRSQAQLDRIFQTEEQPTQSASFDGVRQSFGKPARHDVEPNALDSAFADTSPGAARSVETRGNVQTFGVQKAVR